MNSIQVLIKNKDWKTLSNKYSPIFLTENLSFIDALLLSKMLLENDEWDDTIQTFGINLIKSIKEVYPQKWDSNWRHDAYLGYAYDLRGWNYEEKFDAYKCALEKSITPDPEVLMRLAMTWNYPGVYMVKIDENRAIELLEQALQEIPYIEGVSCLVGLYNEVGNLQKKELWENILEESEKKKLYAPYSFLDFLKA